MTDKRTAKYVVTVDFIIHEQNQYGDTLQPEGFLHYTKELKAKNLGDLGLLLQAVEEIVQ